MNHQKGIRITENYRAWVYKLCIAMSFTVAFSSGAVRVGVYQNGAKIFMDENGQASGIFIDLLNRMAVHEPAYRMPQYLFWAIGVSLGLLVLAAGLVILLHRQVGARTRKLEQANAELRESKQGYQTLARISPVGIFRTDPNGATTYVNPKWCAISGLSADQALGDGWFEAVHPDDKEKLSQGWRKSTQLHEASFSDYRFIRPDGTTAWVMGQAVPEMNAENQIIGYVGTIIDITDRKQMEDDLQFRNILLSIQQEASIDGILVVDENARILSFNRRFVEMWNLPTRLVVDRVDGPVLQFVTEQVADPRSFLQRVQYLYEYRKETSQDELLLADGRVFDRYSAPLLGSDERYFGRVWNFRDITERKKAEEALLASQQIVEGIINSIPVRVFWKDKNLVYLGCNMEFARDAGFADPKDIIGKDDYQMVWRDQAELYRGDDRQVIESGSSKLFIEEPQTTPVGNTITLLTSKIPLRSSEREINGVLGTYIDITERKKAEETLKEYNARLETAVEARTRELRDAQEQLVRQEKLALLGQLAGGVGHELRNPLGVISNAVYYLRLIQPDADEKVNEYLGIIANETNTAEKIITDLLDFSRIKSVDREPIALADLVRLVLERFPPSEDIKVEQKLPEDLPIVYADPRQMAQVLGNLVVNACQAMQNGGTLILSARIKKKEVALSVKDTGMGIPPENMKKLFEPLFTTKAKGIGLGLVVSKKLAEANGGRIEVVSEPGKGSTFTLFLPIKQ